MNFKTIPKRFEGRFGFVNVAATRARQLLDGASPKIKLSSSKAAQVAMTECFESLIEWDYLVEDTEIPQETPSKPTLRKVVNA